ncbi:glutathione ABC transporter substrate-binding protein [Dethiobacter alkaliphilus]|uniref:glutathione ABC transporter substrate-binding protein n=1 Tax=Dethiobacter alkaliphilus TaxID=427926 RepID=UPI002227E780|nr:glutathione ABC transporter substrate-binding protein [Dethiobacter alkaliphilus]MCW3490178.1 glutathione ABC transporter substrate-binding protein [Dethiobacter alkaliphilus]
MRKGLLVILVLTLAAALFLGGCGDNGNNTNDGTDAAQDLVIAIGAEPENLDPITMMSSPAATISEHMAETLIYLDVDGTLQPQLATSWEPSEDDMYWDLTLREGVEFHDGAPFNAEAVKINLDRFMEHAPFAFLLGEVSEVEVVEEYLVRIHLERPFAPIASHLSHSFIAMQSPDSLEKLAEGDFVEGPVGTGPFVYDGWERGQQIKMVRNDNYWGDAPQLETVTFRFIPEEGSRVVALESGEVHAIMAVPPSEIARLQGVDGIDVVEETSVRVIYLGFNQDLELFEDVRVRQALNYAIDKESIVNTIFQGVGSPSTSPIVPAIFGYTEVGPYEYDVEKARDLLAEAGYEDGFEIELYHPTGRYPQDAAVAEAVQAMLAEVGVEAELKTLEWGTYLDTVITEPENAQHDIFMLGWGTMTLDADYGLYALFHSSQFPPSNNVSYYVNDEVDALLDEARVTADRAEREAMYEEAIQTIWEDAPWIFLYDEGQVNAVRSNVQGLIHHPLENLSAWDAWIE